MCVGTGAGVVCFCFAAVTVCWGNFFSLPQFPWRRTASCAFALCRRGCTHFAPRVEADDLIGECGKEPNLELLPCFILGSFSKRTCTWTALAVKARVTVF